MYLHVPVVGMNIVFLLLNTVGILRWKIFRAPGVYQHSVTGGSLSGPSCFVQTPSVERQDPLSSLAS